MKFNVKGVLDKVKNAVQDGVDSVKATTSNITDNIGNVIFAPLNPFKKAMKEALSKKGVVPSDDFLKLIKQFYQYIIPATFEDRVTQYHADAAAVDWGKIADVATKVVPLILQYFKSIKDKKDNGKPLSDSEQKILDAAETLAQKDAVKTGGNDDKQFEIFGINGWYVIGGVAVSGIIIYAYMKHKKKNAKTK